MQRTFFHAVRRHFAERRARRRRYAAVTFFAALPRELQADLMRPSLFDESEARPRLARQPRLG